MERPRIEGVPAGLGLRDPSDPLRRAVELAQRGRMILDVATADLKASEEALGPFHATTWYFRNALTEAQRSWDSLRAKFGPAALEISAEGPPLAVLRVECAGSTMVLIPIGGRTYRAESVAGTGAAPVQWRLTRLDPPHEDGPYYACRLADGSSHCDCAEWTYRGAGPVAGPAPPPGPCKHLKALGALGWLDVLDGRGEVDP